jgi:hypothetical protein
MPDMSDVLEIEREGNVKPKRRFDARDWGFIVEYVISEYERRKQARSDRERHWKEIDRQIAMEPDIGFKKLPNGQIDAKKVWMAEMELPLQAQALEVLTADARRMMFPDSGPWFRAHAEMTDEYLRGADFQSIIHGDEAEVPSQINQDNADKLVEGFCLHLFRQYDFNTRMDRVNAESFKYGMGVARARMETKNVYIHEARGVRKETQKIPVLVPVSIKQLYLDTPMASMHSAQMFGDAHIAEDWIKLENLQVAANKGSNDPANPEGGWMPKNVKGMTADSDGYVHILELEGDLVVPRETVRSVVIPGAIVTVAVGGKNGDEVSRSVVRFRFRKHPFSSYLLFPYHYEDVTNPYPASPLMKGRTVQIMCVDALNRLMDSGALKNAPPVSYDKTDQNFASTGGPEVFPYALWGSSDPNSIKAHMEIGGDQAALANVLALALSMYADLTGTQPPRLGAQTISHTTAFAKDAELQRGAVRTVDYVRQSGAGPVTRWLDMAYRMGRETIGRGPVSFFIDAYGGFVEVPKEMLPERAIFEWFGAGGPAEEAQKKQMRLESLMMALKIDQVDLPMGGKPVVNKAAAIEQLLREGGWTDVDFLTVDTPPAAAPESPAIAQAAIQQLMAPPKAA